MYAGPNDWVCNRTDTRVRKNVFLVTLKCFCVYKNIVKASLFISLCCSACMYARKVDCVHTACQSAMKFNNKVVRLQNFRKFEGVEELWGFKCSQEAKKRENRLNEERW
jgi:hypothetical protein